MNIPVPKFPTEKAFQHGFEMFGEAYLGREDWVCPAFNFAAALAQACVAMGKSCRILEQGVHYPNFYQVILGRSHLAAKSPTLNRMRDGFIEMKQDASLPEIFNLITSINSVEGFREEFNTHVDGDEEIPEPWYSVNNGVRGLCVYDELAVLLSKANAAGASSISAELTLLYNPNNAAVENNTRQNKTYGVDWSVNVFGCSTLAWYEKFLTQGDFTSGFLNRFVFYVHEQMPIHSRFKETDVGALAHWQKRLNLVVRKSLEFNVPRDFQLSDEAFEVYDEWYNDTYAKLLADPDDIRNEAAARIVSHVLKLSLVYAVISGTQDGLISLDVFESAKAVGTYWGECSGMTLDKIDFDMPSKNERIVLEAFKRVWDKQESCTRAELRRAINTKTLSSEALNKAFEACVHSGQLQLVIDPKTQRKDVLKGEAWKDAT